MAANEQQKGNLPQTASPLPLLALLGFGSLSAGLIRRRKK
jgi:LPXTG-motif cell wall-anchored protein